MCLECLFLYDLMYTRCLCLSISTKNKLCAIERADNGHSSTGIANQDFEVVAEHVRPTKDNERVRHHINLLENDHRSHRVVSSP
jgi:hypothetical protein